MRAWEGLRNAQIVITRDFYSHCLLVGRGPKRAFPLSGPVLQMINASSLRHHHTLELVYCIHPAYSAEDSLPACPPAYHHADLPLASAVLQAAPVADTLLSAVPLLHVLFSLRVLSDTSLSAVNDMTSQL
jgi:hypothetical protein